jgi:hypothetical protein
MCSEVIVQYLSSSSRLLIKGPVTDRARIALRVVTERSELIAGPESSSRNEQFDTLPLVAVLSLKGMGSQC